MPAIARILVVFAAVLALARIKVPLGLALILGGITLNLWAGLPVSTTLHNLGCAAADYDVWLLMFITVLIIELGRFMTEERNANELVAATRRWGGRHGRAASLMALPAVIGLIPMPAGALFSAPLVSQAGDGEGATPPWKTAVNYWFRHIWEYWWPLYPGVIVAMAVFQFEAWRFVAVQFLYTPVAVAAGFFFLIRPHVQRLMSDDPATDATSRRALFLLSPIAVVLLALFTMPLVLRPWVANSQAASTKMLSVVIGLVAAVGIIYGDELHRARLHHRTLWPRAMFSSLARRTSRSVLLSLAGVLIFKFMLDASDLLPLAGRELVAGRIPLVVAVAALPFLAGMVTGVAVGFTGVSFPLIVGLMNTEGSGLTPYATLVLAYGFGYMGMMLSPVHLCLVVTKDYFNAPMQHVYRQILPCALVVFTYCIGAHTLLSLLGW